MSLSSTDNLQKNVKCLDSTVNNQTTPTILKMYALRTIDSDPITTTQVYTDDSVFRATIFTG